MDYWFISIGLAFIVLGSLLLGLGIGGVPSLP